MQQITGLSSAPLQSFNIANPETGDKIFFTLTYRPRTQNWYMDISYRSFTEKGTKIIRGPNILNRHKKTFGFGLGVFVTDNFEPYLINDFFTERVKMYILTTAEVDEVDALIDAGTTVP